MVSRSDGTARPAPPLILVPVAYVCRVCGADRKVYVRPVERDGELVVDLDSQHRLTTCACLDCGYERPHVAAETLSGGADDAE